MQHAAESHPDEPMARGPERPDGEAGGDRRGQGSSIKQTSNGSELQAGASEQWSSSAYHVYRLVTSRVGYVAST